GCNSPCSEAGTVVLPVCSRVCRCLAVRTGCNPAVTKAAQHGDFAFRRRCIHSMVSYLETARRLVMARKKRKSSVGKRKTSKASTRKKTRHSKTRRLRERRSQSLGNKVKSAYQTVVDTIRGTDQLRNKLEPPATSETE